MSKMQTNQIPREACQLRAPDMGAVKVDDKAFTLSAYRTGQRVKHPYWGEFVFEVSSMTMAGDKIPVTVDHKTLCGVGYATGISIGDDGVVSFPGEFVENEHSSYVKSYKGTDMFRSSLQFDPMVAEFRWLDENEILEVDGIEQQGPLVVFRNTEVIEVAFTLLPAVTDSSSSFSQPSFKKKEKTMAEDKAKEAEAHKLGHAESIAKFNRMNAMCEDKELVASCFAKEMSLEDFSTEVMKSVKAENTKLRADLDASKTRLEEVEAELAQFKKSSDGQTPIPGGALSDGCDEPKDFMSKVSKFAQDNSLSQGAAFKRLIAIDPEGYKSYREQILGGSK